MKLARRVILLFAFFFVTNNLFAQKYLVLVFKEERLGFDHRKMNFSWITPVDESGNYSLDNLSPVFYDRYNDRSWLNYVNYWEPIIYYSTRKGNTFCAAGREINKGLRYLTSYEIGESPWNIRVSVSYTVVEGQLDTFNVKGPLDLESIDYIEFVFYAIDDSTKVTTDSSLRKTIKKSLTKQDFSSFQYGVNLPELDL